MKKSPLFTIFLTVFIDLIGFSIAIPILSSLIQSPFGKFFPLIEPSQRNIVYGFLIASYPIAAFIATPIIGELSDKYGRKPLLAISLIGSLFARSLFILGIVNANLPLLFIARSLDGITGGNISVAQSAIADVSTPETKAKNFGIIGMAFGLGFVLGPYIGARLADYQILGLDKIITPLLFATVLCLINILSVFFVFPETLKEKSKSVKVSFFSAFRNVKKAFSIKSLTVILLVSFLFNFGFNFFTSFSNYYFIQTFNFTFSNIGDLFAYIGIWIAITQGAIVRPLVKKYPASKLVKFALPLTSLGLLLLLYPKVFPNLAGNSNYLYLVLPVFAIFNGIVTPNLIGLVSNSADPKEQGEVLGINASIGSLAQAIPPILAAYIANISNELPLIVGAGVIFVAFLIFATSYKEQKFKIEE
ncbi:MFS transporter [bacterium]|nr:MAG: MFS transporter [bacterium]